MTADAGTPLTNKLGIQKGHKRYIKNVPANYLDMLGQVPIGIVLVKHLTSELDMIHLFTQSAAELHILLKQYISNIKSNGMIWVSLPKKVSTVATEITEDVVRK